MDRTVETYKTRFENYIKGTPHEVAGDQKIWLDAFLSLLPAGGRIFELGSAFGRDATYIREKGFNVFCTDIIPDALQLLRKQKFEADAYDFRDAPKPEWVGSFEGVLAAAVLLHAPTDAFDAALQNLETIARPGGIVAFSVKTGVGEEETTKKMDAPRYFKYWQPDELRTTLMQHAVEIVSLDIMRDGTWLHVILKTRGIS